MNPFKLGGYLLAVGAGIALLVKVYWFIMPVDSPFSISYKVVGTILGYWFAQLIMPPPIDGGTIEFSWASLIWIPWAAVFIIFLFWVAVTVIRDKFISHPAILPVLGVLGSWFIVALVYEKISNGFGSYTMELKWILAVVLSDLSIIAIITGIALIIFNYKNSTTNSTEDISGTGALSFSRLFFSIDGRINRSKFWLYQVLFMNLILIVFSLTGAAFGKEDGFVTGYIIGLIVVLWPTLALAIKRCHDRNRSGAFILVSFIPIVSIWYVIEVLFLKGTDGDNKYGPDPLMQQMAEGKVEQADS